MSVAGISSAISALYQLGQNNSVKSIQSEFQQLGQDLASGSISQAQTDYNTLTQSLSALQPASTTSATQAFNQLGSDLKSGNLSAAQQDFTQIQQDLQQASAMHGHHHHHHRLGGAAENPGTANSQQPNEVASLLAELSQNLQAGKVTAAQQTYSSLQQDFPLFSAGASNNLGSGALSFTA